jgi:hypothetical protein
MLDLPFDIKAVFTADLNKQHQETSDSKKTKKISTIRG